MKKAVSLALVTLIVFSMLSILQINPVMATTHLSIPDVDTHAWRVRTDGEDWVENTETIIVSHETVGDVVSFKVRIIENDDDKPEGEVTWFNTMSGSLLLIFEDATGRDAGDASVVGYNLDGNEVVIYETKDPSELFGNKYYRLFKSAIGSGLRVPFFGTFCWYLEHYGPVLPSPIAMNPPVEFSDVNKYDIIEIPLTYHSGHQLNEIAVTIPLRFSGLSNVQIYLAYKIGHSNPYDLPYPEVDIPQYEQVFSDDFTGGSTFPPASQAKTPGSNPIPGQDTNDWQLRIFGSWHDNTETVEIEADTVTIGDTVNYKISIVENEDGGPIGDRNLMWGMLGDFLILYDDTKGELAGDISVTGYDIDGNEVELLPPPDPSELTDNLFYVLFKDAVGMMIPGFGFIMTLLEVLTETFPEEVEVNAPAKFTDDNSYDILPIHIMFEADIHELVVNVPLKFSGNSLVEAHIAYEPYLDRIPFDSVWPANQEYEGNFACVHGVAPALDVYMLVDLSGSFSDDLPIFKVQAPNIISNLKASNPGTRFGLGKFEDYPIPPFGYASWGDKAYERVIDLTFDTDAVLSCISALFTRYGGDGPQSQLPALYQAATGAGQDLSGVGFPGASIPPGQQANFRDGAAKLFILWTDAPFHNPGDPGTIPYPGPSFDQTVEAINALDPPMVIGISSGSGGVADLKMIATATGALAPIGGVDTNGDGIIDILEGEPLVCAISSSGVGIAEAIESLVEAAAVLPVADANGPYEGETGTTLVLDGSNSFDSDGYIALYEWDFDGDGTFDFSSTDSTVSHTYATAFTGVVILRVTDNEGNTDTDEAAITIVQADNIPPETWLVIGDPKCLIDGTTYLTSATSMTLFAEDDPGGTGVASTSYRIYSATYDSGWMVYPASFYLSGLSDGEYSIDYYSTDNVGNTEATNAATVILDNTGPLITVSNPPAGWALQDGVTFFGSITDAGCGVFSMSFSIREANDGEGIPIGFEDLAASYDPITGEWSFSFDTLLVPDGYYVLHIEAEDNLGNEASTIVPYSIRNWAVIDLLPASESNKAGRTMPVKFALRVAAEVDPNQPFVYNEELRIEIFATADPDNVLQESYYGDTARDYRISSTLYITNFKTIKRTPMEYTVAIYRDTFDVGSFTFETVK